MSEPSSLPVVRAVDVGYGHVKYVLRQEVETNKIHCDGFPSRSPRAQGTDLSAGVMSKLDTIIVEVGGHRYEVGKNVISAASANDASEVLTRDFALSDAYMARLYGALSYMLAYLDGNKIDWLILGLPNLTINTVSSLLEKRVLGKHVINCSGATVEIEKVRIFPQPLGAFFDYGFRQGNLNDLRNRVNLVVDSGYNTFDWLLSEGLAPSPARSGSVELGMSAVVRAIAEEVLRENKGDASANIDRVVNRIDAALCNSESYRLFGKEIDLKRHLSAGDTVIEQAISMLEKNVGAGDDIDNIFIAGGGAPLYFKALQARYPHHNIIQITDPQFANVRGFQIVGTNWAHSAHRAGSLAHV